MNIPNDLRYTKSHEWVRSEGKIAVVGITHFAQDALGDIVFAELPGVGDDVTRGEEFGVVESVKAVSDVYSPISGQVEEVNDQLETTPELINEDPYGEGWILKIKVSDPADLEDLMTPEDYQEHLLAQ